MVGFPQLYGFLVVPAKCSSSAGGGSVRSETSGGKARQAARISVFEPTRIINCECANAPKSAFGYVYMYGQLAGV